jgi:adhesin transport system membrane fusion protein
MMTIDQTVRDYKPRRANIGAWIIMSLIGAFFAWAGFASLDEVAVANGEVVPQGQVKLIQHLEGGIVSAIHVADGQQVNAGSPLIRLDLGLNRATAAELKLQTVGLELKKTRLQAEATDSTPAFPPASDSAMSALIENERATLETRRKQQKSNLEILHAQERQRELEIEEITSRLDGRLASLKLADERLAMSKALEKDQLITRMEVLDLTDTVAKLKSEIAELRSSLPRSRESLEEARRRIQNAKLDVQRDATEEIGKIDLAIASIRNQLEPAKDQLERTVITSPIEGVVKNLRNHTIGGVVRPGEPIMEIVPTRDRLVVECKLNAADVGYVRAGQKAVVKLQTFDFVRYGSIEGTVKTVAPDSTTGADGVPYFRVVVETDKNYLGTIPGRYPITAGMQATVDIHTGSRLVIDYLISPVIKLRHEAFRER